MHFFIWTLPFFVSAVAASHTIHFLNYCGSGTPTVYTHGKRTSIDDGTTYSSNEDDYGVIYTFLEQGSCGNDGIKCTTVGVDLTIPEASLSKKSKYSVPLSLQYSCANGSVYFAQCYSLGCAPTPISCNSFNSELIMTFCPLSSLSSIKPKDSSLSSTLIRKLIAPIVIIIILMIALRALEFQSAEEVTFLALGAPERASTLTVPSYQSGHAASTINKESWEDFKSGSYFVKLHATESEMSVFED
ncbi:hypothetical protein EDD18DRAFT_1416732 [Armillaria luteobubalina]|uniref:Autophagy-related protein 27 n=1 Tax=Armillaria luteobubalina TaxID=153913 RepID=A0AA39PT97_9AGAR|nr:hypothetical protein EDD18DRAFT_1416732 [Armillaria luteobubalina]